MVACNRLRFERFGCTGGWDRAGTLAGDQQDPNRRRDRASARVFEMPHVPGRRGSRDHLFADIPYRQFDMRADRAQLERFAPDMATNLQGSAGYGADR